MFARCLFVLAAVSLSAVPSFAQTLPKEIRNRVMHSTAFIQGKAGHGSGFVVLPGVFATNAHVVRDDLIEDVRARFVDADGNETKFAVKLLAIDKARDLALLWAKDLPAGYKPLTVAGKVDIGRKPRVFVIGNPGQAEGGVSLINSVGPGTLADEMVMMDGKPFYQLTVQTAADKIKVGPGNSGGPVVDERGDVVGVLTAGLIDRRTGKPTDKMYTIPATAVHAAVAAVGAAGTWETVGLKAVERHATDLTVRSIYANVLIAETVLEARRAIWENAVRGGGFFRYVNGNPVSEDAGMIDLFNKCDKAVRDKTRLTAKTALEGTLLPKDQKQNLRTIIGRMESIRPVVTGKRATLAQVKKCEEMIAECHKAFDKLAADTGWTRADATNVELQILLDAGVKLVAMRARD